MATQTSSEQVPTDGSGLLDRIAGIQDLIAKNGPQGERDRRVAEESIQALHEIGAFRVSSPKKYGGYGMGHREAMEVGRAVGMADGGTAWVVSLINSGAWYVTMFSEQAQDDVFEGNPDARVSAVIAPTGVARRVPGGYRVSGKWFYNSGSWHAEWVLAAAQFEDEDGNNLGAGQALMPASEYEIEDVWYVAGMRSSGSNCMVAEDVFVPEHRVITPDAPLDPRFSTEYRSASVPMALVGPQLGLARRVYNEVVSHADTKSIAYTTLKRQSDSAPFQLAVAEAAQRLDIADFFANRAANAMDSIDANNAPLSRLERSRVRADVGCAIDSVTKAIDQLITAHGSAAFAESNIIQRHWRDQAVVGRHGYVNPPLAMEVYGKAILGVEDSTTALI